MQRFLLALAFAAASGVPASSQDVRDFLPQHSRVSSQGSKLWLAFERFDADPALFEITVDPLRNIEEVFFTISYPTYGSATQREEVVVTAKRLSGFNDTIDSTDVTILVCHLDGDIHDTDEVETSFTLLEGWAVGNNEETGLVDAWTPDNDPGSDVAYPKPIASWDMVPHQIYPLDPENPQPFHVDLVVFHRYSYEHSAYGDFEAIVWIDENPEEESAPPTTGPKLVATARPSYKVPERDDIFAGTYLVYRATFDPADYIENSTIVDGEAYIHFKITPSRGDADSILFSPGYHDKHVWDPADLPDSTDPDVMRIQPNLETMKVFLNGGETLDADPLYAYVDPVGGDDADSDWSGTKQGARDDPFKTIFGAIQAYQGGTINPIVLLKEGTHWPDRAPGAAGNADIAGDNWLTIMPDDNVSREQVEITDVALTVKSSIPLHDDVFEIVNNTGGAVEWRWRTGQNHGLQIRQVGSGFDETFPRAGLTIAQLENDIDTQGINGLAANSDQDLDHLSVDEDLRYFDATTEFVQIPNGQTGDVLIHSVIATRSGTAEEDVYVFADSQEFTYDFDDDDFDTVAEIVADMNIRFGGLEADVIQNIDLDKLQSRRYQIPAEFKEGEIVWCEADTGTGGLRYPFVRFFNCWIRSNQLTSNHVATAPRHLWLDEVLFKHESKSSVESAEVTAAAGHWQGGIWYTGCDFNFVNKSAAGPVMIRDAWFNHVGGDSGKQVSLALNWFAQDVSEVPGDPLHPDYFQSSFLDNAQQQIESGDHGNIIALNLDFRDEENYGQPFLLNVPNNTDTTHHYTGIAFVNFRMNSDLAQQFCGEVDHLLIWNCDVFQKFFEDPNSVRRVHLRGVPDTDNQEHESTYHNVSVRNTVVERMLVNAVTDTGPGFVGDVPSLWSMIDSSFFTTQLRDEFDIDLTPTEIATIHDSLKSVDADVLVNFATDWSPQTSAPGDPILLIDRLTAEDIVYRMDASGTERLIHPVNMVGAVGAMEHPDNALGQPAELDAYSVDVGSAIISGVTDNPLADLVLSDDQRLHVTSSGLVVELVVDGLTRVANPATLDLTFEGRLTTGTMTNGATLALWDWNAQPPAWVPQGSNFTISSTEAVQTRPGIAATNFIETGTGLIRYRIRLFTAIWFGSAFTLQADQMKIVVKP